MNLSKRIIRLCESVLRSRNKLLLYKDGNNFIINMKNCSTELMNNIQNTIDMYITSGNWSLFSEKINSDYEENVYSSVRGIVTVFLNFKKVPELIKFSNKIEAEEFFNDSLEYSEKTNEEDVSDSDKDDSDIEDEESSSDNDFGDTSFGDEDNPDSEEQISYEELFGK